MTETNPINNNSRGRPRNPDRLLADGKYNSKPLDPQYFKKYYQEKTKLKRATCCMCGVVISDSSNMAKHQKTTKCRANSDTHIKVQLALLALTAIDQQLSSEQDASP
jgi:ribosomal protein S27AE